MGGVPVAQPRVSGRGGRGAVTVSCEFELLSARYFVLQHDSCGVWLNWLVACRLSLVQKVGHASCVAF